VNDAGISMTDFRERSAITEGAITNSRVPATRPKRPSCGFRVSASMLFSEVSTTAVAAVDFRLSGELFGVGFAKSNMVGSLKFLVHRILSQQAWAVRE